MHNALSCRRRLREVQAQSLGTGGINVYEGVAVGIKGRFTEKQFVVLEHLGRPRLEAHQAFSTQNSAVEPR